MLMSRHDVPSANTNFFGVRSAAVKEKVSPKLLRSEADALEKKEAKEVLRAATQLAEKEKHANEVAVNSARRFSSTAARDRKILSRSKKLPKLFGTRPP